MVYIFLIKKDVSLSGINLIKSILKILKIFILNFSVFENLWLETQFPINVRAGVIPNLLFARTALGII